MDKPSLEGIDLRIRRAADHLAVLNNAVTRFLREKRENIVGEYVIQSAAILFSVLLQTGRRLIGEYPLERLRTSYAPL